MTNRTTTLAVNDLAIYHHNDDQQDTHFVAHDELETTLTKGNPERYSSNPDAGGIVLVRLDVDGENFSKVEVQAPVSEHAVDIIRLAIEHLEQVAAALVRMEER
jgi:hypothetical protein